MRKSRFLLVLCLSLANCGLHVSISSAADAPPPKTDAKAFKTSVDKATEFLQTKGMAADGSYSAPTGVGVTGIVATAILRHGRSPQDPAVAKSLKYLEGFVKPDGGIYVADTFYKNYETSVAVMAFVEANRDKRYDKLVKNAEKFLKGIQWDEGQGKDKSDFTYGGAGYGKSKRPDLSNTAFFMEALKTAGVGPNDPNMQKALIFVSRCQNLETEANPTPFPAKNPDGGFYYTPASGGVSMAPPMESGGLRSYASMTYAGLKSMIYAGVGPNDPRVKAAMKWIQKNYDLDSNAGMGQEGLYYYYHTFAKALSATGLDTIEDAKGQKHDWRQELRDELISRQQADGSWINDNKRWMEDDPSLVTAYALLALSYCKPAAGK